MGAGGIVVRHRDNEQFISEDVSNYIHSATTAIILFDWAWASVGLGSVSPLEV